MAEKSWFFNSELVDGVYDRTYDANDFANFITALWTDGVLRDSQLASLAVVESSGMGVAVGTGSAVLNGHIYTNTGIMGMNIDAADEVYTRIDTIALGLNLVNREIKCKVYKGTPAANPVAPTLTNGTTYPQYDNDSYFLPLADIRVKAFATEITNADITNRRKWSTGNPSDVSSDYMANLHALYDDWAENLVNQLSDNQAANLQLQITDIRRTMANLYDITIQITPDAWEVYSGNSDYYSYDVSSSYVFANSDVFLWPDYSFVDEANASEVWEQWKSAEIVPVETYAGGFTIVCLGHKPTVTLTMKFRIGRFF